MKELNIEEVLTIIFEESSGGFWKSDIPANKEYYSPSFKKMLGYNEHDFPASPQTWMHLVWEDDLPLVTESFKKHIASKGAIPFENRVRYKHCDGLVVNVLLKGKVIEWDEENNPLNMVGYVYDITNAVKTEEELKKSNEQKEMILEGIDAGIWDRNYETNEDWWSAKFYELIGYKPPEIKAGLDTFLNTLLHSDDKEVVSAAIKQHCLNATLFKMNVRLKTKNGVYSWFESSAIAKLNAEGKPLRMAGCIINIDKRIHMQQQIEQSEFLLKQTNEMAKVGGWEYHIDAQKIEWSKEVYDIHELSPDFTPTLDSILEPYLPEYRNALLNAIDNVITAKTSYDLELILRTNTGKYKWVRSIGRPVLNNHNQVIGLRGAVQDIDDKKTKELELQRSTNIISEQNNRLKNFAHIVSHNLRSHAGNIQTVISLLKMPNTQEDQKLFIDNLEKVSRALNQTISHLTEVVKIQTEVSKSKTGIRFDEIFSSVINILTPTINETGAHVIADFSACPTIEYVPAYLESILLNLVSNAIKYRHPQRQPVITVTSFLQGGKTCLTVQDNGIGIDLKKHKDKVFGMYKTFHKHPDARGIGLFITKNQVEALGGTITVASEPNAGTTFTITF